MSARNLGFVGCRLLAIYWLAHALFSFEWVIHLVVQTFLSHEQAILENEHLLTYSLVSFIFYVFFSLLMWFGAAKVSKLIVSDDLEKTDETKFEIGGIQSLAFSVLGLFFLVKALPEFIYRVFFAFLSNAGSNETTSVSTTYETTFFAVVAYMIIGIYLLIGSRGLSNLVLRFKQFGLKKD